MGRWNRQHLAPLNLFMLGALLSWDSQLLSLFCEVTALQPGHLLTVFYAPPSQVLQRLTALGTAPKILKEVFMSHETGPPY